MEEITIRPPYGLEDISPCRGKEGSKALEHVKKIVSQILFHDLNASYDLQSKLSSICRPVNYLSEACLATVW